MKPLPEGLHGFLGRPAGMRPICFVRETFGRYPVEQGAHSYLHLPTRPHSSPYGLPPWDNPPPKAIDLSVCFCYKWIEPFNAFNYLFILSQNGRADERVGLCS